MAESNYKKAITLAKAGYYVFPLVAGTKFPVFKGPYRTYATRSAKKIKSFWRDEILDVDVEYDIGISTDKFNGGGALVVVDVDKSETVDGFETLKTLPNFTKTASQKTPRGGLHLIYRTKKAITQGAGVLGKGIDIRSRGGLFKYYDESLTKKKPATCPNWIETFRPKKETHPVLSVKEPDYMSDLTAYLPSIPVASEGNRAAVSYQVACMLKDQGVGLKECSFLMQNYWNNSYCTPPLDPTELGHQVRSAYKYGKNEVGSALAENDFEKLEAPSDEVVAESNPVLKYNKDFAFILEGGKSAILWETEDVDGKFFVDRLNIESFHQRFAADTVMVGDNWKPATRVWMCHPERRTYDKVIFLPGKKVAKTSYNLWNGFNEVPLAKDETPTQQMVDGLGAFTEHLVENVCGKDKSQVSWLTSYFAHLIQFPWEKPLVALVLCGAKGVGKDSLIDRVGHLINRYYIMAANPRFFIGNFNAHLEHCLLIALNEAFWSGDKNAEGSLKNLITGSKHIIERKGKEATIARNFTRVVIMGNESWLVPATFDERRFAVFNVGTGKMQNTKFFKDMRVNMEAGGYRYLLKYLLEYKIDSDINLAPNNRALLEQKSHTLDPFSHWWWSCLTEGYIDPRFDESWPKEISCSDLREIFYKASKDRGIRSRLPDMRFIGKELRQFYGICSFRKSKGINRYRVYQIPPLEVARKKWDKHMKCAEQWPEEDPLIDELSEEEIGL